MKCSVGVAIAAVVVLLGSAFAFLGAFAMLYGAIGPMQDTTLDPGSAPPGFTPERMRAVVIGMSIFMFALASLGTATGVGLIRLWRWARYSIITFGGILTAIGAVSLVFFLLVPMPLPGSQGNPGIATAVRVGLSLFYGAWVAFGLWFVLFFSRKKIADQFRGGAAETQPLRPVSITVIGWLMILAVPGCAMGLAMHAPGIFLGVVLRGGSATAFYTGYAAIYAILGIGLLRLKPMAYWVTLGLHVIALVNVLTLLIPSVWQRYMNVIQLTFPAYMTQTPSVIQIVALGSGLVTIGVTLYFLLTRQKRFLEACATAAAR
jgi:hypothetical protein